MDTTSVWRASAPESGFALLQGDVSTDVLVVGGGITGVTLALLLAEKGRSVVLLEADTIGSGSTGNSTGNLYKTLSQGLHGITTRWGEEVASQAVAQREVSAPLPRPAGSVLVLDSQAQIQPQAYVNHLARRAAGAGAHVHEHSRAIELDHKAMRAATAMGSVNAQEIVLATHSPKGFHIVQAEMPVHREYGIARPLDGTDPGPGIFWYRGDERYSVRTMDAGGQRYLVCVGQEQRTGLHDAKASLMALEVAAAKQFGAAQVAYRWSAQNYRSAEGLPYIGRDASGCFHRDRFFNRRAGLGHGVGAADRRAAR